MRLKSIYLVVCLSLFNAGSMLAARMVLALYALELGAQPLAIGILAAAFSVFPILLSVPAGRLADRFGSRWLLVFGGCAGAIGMLMPYLHASLPAIFAAAAISGMSIGIYNVLLQNLTGLVSSQQDRAKNFSNFSLSRSIAHVAGPLIGGILIDYSGHGNSCLYLTLLTLIPVVMLAIWGDVLPGGTRRATHATGGVRAMLTEPGVRRILAISSLLQTGQDMYSIYLPVYGHAIGLSASSIGIVLAMYSAAMFFVRLIMPRLMARFREETLLACAFYVGAMGLMLIPFFTNTALLALLSFLFGLGMGCSQPIITMLMFSNSADGRSGEALGLRTAVTHVTKLIGPVAYGSLGSAFGLFPMFWISALMLGAGGMFSRPPRKM